MHQNPGGFLLFLESQLDAGMRLCQNIVDTRRRERELTGDVFLQARLQSVTQKDLAVSFRQIVDCPDHMRQGITFFELLFRVGSETVGFLAWFNGHRSLPCVAPKLIHRQIAHDSPNKPARADDVGVDRGAFKAADGGILHNILCPVATAENTDRIAQEQFTLFHQIT